MRKRALCIICGLLVLTAANSYGFTKPASPDDSTAAKNARKRNTAEKVLLFHYVDDIYKTSHLERAGLDSIVFQNAIIGYYNLKQANVLPANSTILTVIDFTKPAMAKRMWIIDLDKKKLLLNTKIAQGQVPANPDRVANHEPIPESNVGFFITNEVITDKAGAALKLDGVDDGFNDKALEREFVLYGSDEITKSGRSLVCPAVATETAPAVLDALKNKSLLFIAGKDATYTSKYLDEDQAAKFAHADSSYNLVKDIFN